MARRSQPTKRLRVRSKRLDQLDETKLALALWLMAKDMLAADLATLEGASGQVSSSDELASGDMDDAEAA
jgi:hypothetical protein